MNLSPRWAAFLQDAGYSATHWSRVGEPFATDREICQAAREQDSIVITNDLDFPQILALTHDDGPSVILMRGEPLSPESRGNVLLALIGNHEDALAKGAIVTVDWSGRGRSRLLPL